MKKVFYIKESINDGKQQSITILSKNEEQINETVSNQKLKINKNVKPCRKCVWQRHSHE